jgi:serine/threonine-protein phosphatase 2A activator
VQQSIVPIELHPILPELIHHFTTCFGSAPRLDYGTGHELSFLAYLLILRLVGILTEADEQAMVTRVFVAYLDVVRKLQKVYKLEPAGSKGVWGLDDHQHLVYIWGASQLKSEAINLS